jgi:hypothetical protein
MCRAPHPGCGSQGGWPVSRPRRTCELAGCESDHYGIGYCRLHWQRQHFRGTTELTTTQRLPLVARFAARIEPGEHGCWNWTKAVGRGGYSVFYVGGTPRVTSGHRWAWQHFVGPIPEGHEIDHRCGNTRCVRPGHCQTLTPEEHRRVTAERKALRDIIGPDESLAPDNTHTELERAFGQAHGLPVADTITTMPRPAAQPITTN